MSIYLRPKSLTPEQKSKGVKQKLYIRIRVPTAERYKNGRKKYIDHYWSAGDKGAVSKKYLEERCRELKRKYLGHKVLDDIKAVPPFAIFAAEYIKHKKEVEKRRSTQRMEIALNNLMQYFGKDIQLSNIDANTIDGYKDFRLSKGIKAATVNRELAILKSFINTAIKSDYVNLSEHYKGLNPVTRAGLLNSQEKQERKKLLPPSDSDIRKILMALPAHIRRVCLNQLYTGMRVTETLNLRKDNLKVLDKHHIIYLNASQVKERKDKIIPLNNQAKKNIDDALTENISKYVFTNSFGKKFEGYSQVNRFLIKACEKAGVNKITSHSLRAKFSSKAVDEGANPYAISKLLGHSSIKVTDEHYITLDKSLLEAVNFTNYE